MDIAHADKRHKLSDAQVVTCVVLAAKYFYGNQALESHYGFKMPHKSNFNRRLHKSTDLITQIFTSWVSFSGI